ncbi:Polyketide synthase enoylreductase [Penicillium nucicola]|uniref:Polyketide synthase enoylreductase n=1 Tax=Penicillium nucicola TaxID=1850975 RepID=UPI002544F52F|nr:Polyketide synthase enoylreductase [Penicillium nucicola]KAJ5753584.1 Polyketide synthase enoylreductase [Penicillium nucicola]
MSDSEERAPSRTKGKRTISGLTAAQITHKRELDRKAQRAMRQRTKHRIEELENDIAVFKNSFSQREKSMIEEIQLLRDQNRQLKSSLESIGQFAIGNIPVLPETDIQRATSGVSATKQVISTPEDGRRGIDIAQPQSVTAEPHLVDHGMYLADQILLDFIISRRSMLARGVPLADVLGAEQICPSDLLNPTAAPSSHAISRIMAEVLTTFPHVNMPEKLAFMYLMHHTTRWQISPNSESYARMPVWLRPTVMQVTIPHAAWIDNIPWPRVRDILIGDPDRYPFAVFSELYSQHVTISWPYDCEDIVVNSEEGKPLNTIFEKHILRLSNWFAPRQFRDFFSEWTSDVYIDE